MAWDQVSFIIKHLSITYYSDSRLRTQAAPGLHVFWWCAPSEGSYGGHPKRAGSHRWRLLWSSIELWYSAFLLRRREEKGEVYRYFVEFSVMGFRKWSLVSKVDVFYELWDLRAHQPRTLLRIGRAEALHRQVISGFWYKTDRWQSRTTFWLLGWSLQPSKCKVLYRVPS